MSRVECRYRPENGRFLLECDFSKQYNHYYRKRYEKTKPFLEFNCRQKWDPNLNIYSLAGMTGNSQCIVTGIIFKRMKHQPNVVDEVSQGDFHLKCERYLGHYASPDDTLVLEDTEESIELVGKIDPKAFVTGIVVALLGVPINDGAKFLVDDVCFAEPNCQILYERSIASNISIERPLELADSRPIYLLVVSGLGFYHDMGEKSKLTAALQELIDFVWGGGKFSNDERCSQVARILVVGNNLHADRFPSPDDEDSLLGIDKNEIAIKMKQSRQVKPYTESIKATRHMDDFFAQLAKTINIDVMPGPSDPSSHLMPQQPFHPCMFPKSSMFPTFNSTTNPYHAVYNDSVEILATSGQNVDIISKFSSLSDPIEIMKCHLRWGNSAPSAPDNLYSVPYEDEDPYVIDFIPNIYIAGCQKEYKTDYYHYNSNDLVKASIASQHQDSLDNSLDDSNLINVTPDSELTSTPVTSRRDNFLTPPKIKRARECEETSTPNFAGELWRLRGNEEESHESGGSKLEKTLLITIPEFCETFSCVLVDLNTLISELITFGM